MKVNKGEYLKILPFFLIKIISFVVIGYAMALFFILF